MTGISSISYMPLNTFPMSGYKQIHQYISRGEFLLIEHLFIHNGKKKKKKIEKRIFSHHFNEKNDGPFKIIELI